jgi:hypothetical protein
MAESKNHEIPTSGNIPHEHDPPTRSNEPESKRKKQDWLAFRGTRRSRVGADYQVTALPTPGQVATSVPLLDKQEEDEEEEEEDKEQNVVVEPETDHHQQHPSHNSSSSSSSHEDDPQDPTA